MIDAPMFDALGQPFFQRALIAGLLASLVCGIVGTFVVVKRISSISGGLAHAAFGGVGLGYVLGINPVVGAAGFALLTSLGIGYAYRRQRQSLDTLIVVCWSVGMALGITLIALTPGYAPDLMSYLFGSILFVDARYLMAVVALDVVLVLFVSAFYRRLQAVVFEEEFAEITGIGVNRYLLMLLALVALSTVILMRVVGIILVIALLTMPAVVARNWSGSLLRMMVLATLIGAVCTTVGLFVASYLDAGYGLDVPAGPLIVLVAAMVYGGDWLLRLGRS